MLHGLVIPSYDGYDFTSESFRKKYLNPKTCVFSYRRVLGRARRGGGSAEWVAEAGDGPSRESTRTVHVAIVRLLCYEGSRLYRTHSFDM